MSEFHTLPPDTVDLIRSGQVITSVFCVVKELLENAIDAEASSVEIRLEDFGLELVEVKDNGTGVSKSDLELMTAPFSTSKISSFEDLTSDKLRSFGFRGEALNSLCSVSEVEITTKTSKDVAATVAVFDKGGKILKKSNAAGTVGTIVKIRKLFENLPVRRNYYEKSKSRKEDDLKKIKHLVSSYALIFPELRVVFQHGRKEILRKLPASDPNASIGQVIGIDTFRQMHEMKIEVGESEITGTILVPRNDNLSMKLASKTSPEKMYYFVNNRLVMDKSLDRLIRKCFPMDRYPVVVVSIQIRPELLDVNLEPSKLTVMIRCQKELEITIENLMQSYYEVRCDNNQQPFPSKSTPSKENQVSYANKTKSHHGFKFQSLLENSTVLADAKTQHNLSTYLTGPSKTVFEESGVSADSEHQIIPSREKIEASKTLAPPIQKIYPVSSTATSNNAETNSKVANLTLNEHRSKTKSNDHISEPPVSQVQTVSLNNGMVKETVFKMPLTTPENSKASTPEILSPLPSNKRAVWPVFSPNKSAQDSSFEDLSKVYQRKRAKYDDDPSQPKIANFIPTRSNDESMGSETPVVSWNRGNSVQDSKGETIHPVVIGKANFLQEKISKSNSGSVKSDKSQTRIKDCLKKSSPSTTEKTRTVLQTELMINFNLKKIRDSQSCIENPSSVSKPQIVGQLTPSGYWIYLSPDNAIHLLNHHRVMEVDIYKKLMRSQKLPSALVARGPVELTDDSRWISQYSSILQDISNSNLNSCEISDPRLTFNGIFIQARPGIGRYLLTSVASCVNFMGPDDVIEVLKVISLKPDATVAECRPLKVKNYFMAEAVRLMRQGSPQVDYETVEHLVEVITREQVEKCLHESNVSERLVRCDELHPDEN